MTMLLTWQGSEVRRVELAEGAVLVHFSAASARSDGEEGFLQALTVAFANARVQGDVDSALGSLAEGALLHNGQVHRHLPLPFCLTRSIQAELVFRNGTVLQIDAEMASCSPDPGGRFVESMAC